MANTSSPVGVGLRQRCAEEAVVMLGMALTFWCLYSFSLSPTPSLYSCYQWPVKFTYGVFQKLYLPKACTHLKHTVLDSWVLSSNPFFS